jgi:hypothetical protein
MTSKELGSVLESLRQGLHLENLRRLDVRCRDLARCSPNHALPATLLFLAFSGLARRLEGGPVDAELADHREARLVPAAEKALKTGGLQALEELADVVRWALGHARSE